jgi:hypothetical protein
MASALVIVDEKVNGRELRDALIEQLDGETSEVFVIAPALADSTFKHVMGDIDEAVGPARERLEAALAALREAGLEARGEVGDSDPIQAIHDGVVKLGPQRVLVVAHPGGEAAFAEKGLFEQAERVFDLPVTELLVDHAEQPHVLDVKRTEPVAGRDKTGWRPSFNLPPFSKRELAGILVAIVGTILLGILASKGVANSEGEGIGGAAAAMVLIALAMALINLAHVVGLFLFQSVRYDGMFSRLFSRLSLFGTPTAIVASLILLTQS